MAGTDGDVIAVIARDRGRGLWWSDMRVQEGELVRFDSVTTLVDECRLRFATMHVRTATRGGEFLLYVKLPDGSRFESLIAHFEGEGTYAVMLPGAPMRSASESVATPYRDRLAQAAQERDPPPATMPEMPPSWTTRLRRWWDRRRPAVT